MTPQAVFSAASVAAMVAWLLLLAAWAAPAGRWRECLRLLGGRIVPALLCLAYVAVLATHWGPVPGGGFGSLHSVVALFAVPGKMLGGWLHFLAFDLLVGCWMLDDSLQAQRPRWRVLPALALTFIFGPAGWLLHLATRGRPVTAVLQREPAA